MPDELREPGPSGNPDAKADMRIAALVLAAGASRRLGEPKQLVQIEGESLLRRTTRIALEAGYAPVFAILGFAAERMRPELDGLGIQVVVNSNWEEGMGSSLRCGLQAVMQEQPTPDAVLVLVCDQVRLNRVHLRTLLQRHAEGNGAITASTFAGRMGVPAVFGAEYFPELLNLQGDRGARELIRAASEQVNAVEWPDGELDLDHPEQLNRLPLH